MRKTDRGGARDVQYQSARRHNRLVEEILHLGYALVVTVVVVNGCPSLSLEMNYSLTCQINNDPVFSGLLSPCPTYRFLGERTHHFDMFAVYIHRSGHAAPR